MTHATAQTLTMVAARDATRERTLTLVARLALSGMVAAVAVFGYTEGTLRIFYPLLMVSGAVYVFARGERLLEPALRYLASPLMRWRWMFILWAAASLFWTTRSGTSVGRVVTLLQIYGIGMLFYDAVRSLGLGRWVLQNLFAWTVVGIVVALATGVATAGGRLTGFYGNPNVLSIAALLGLTVFAAGVTLGRGAGGRVITQLAALVLIAGVAASSSRKGLLGVPLVWLLGLLAGRARGRILVQMLLVAAIGAALVATVEPLRALWQFTVGRVTDLFVSFWSRSGGTRSVVERSTFIREGMVLIGRSPVVGHGIGSFRWLAGQGKYAHNNMIDIGVGLGLTGLCLYYGLHAALLARAAFIRERAGDVSRFVLVFVPSFLLLDIGVVSYYMKAPAILFIVCAAWFDRLAEEGFRS